MTLNDDAKALVETLNERDLRIVVAESCTGGMVSAELAKVPGVSERHCGSAVTYRNDTKSKWLGVDEADIRRYTAVSSQVAEQMASGVLEKTPEADVAASITGHFGPNAPDGFDGLVFIGTAIREPSGMTVRASEHRLRCEGRLPRQEEATALMIRTLRELVESPGA